VRFGEKFYNVAVNIVISIILAAPLCDVWCFDGIVEV